MLIVYLVKSKIYTKVLLIVLLFFVLPVKGQNPKIAILIDDVGARTSTLHEFFAVQEKITFAVLPFLAKSKECNDLIIKNKYKSILHLPLESKGNSVLNEKTPGMIKTSMTKAKMQQLFEIAIENIGGNVAGFNNHTGSQFTSDSWAMFNILNFAKAKKMYFIDSNTYNRIGYNGVISNPHKAYSYRYAKGLGLKTYYNSLFIDNLKESETIEKVLLSAVPLAKAKGKLLIIGHYRSVTAQALLSVKEKMKSQGIKFVFVEEIIE